MNPPSKRQSSEEEAEQSKERGVARRSPSPPRRVPPIRLPSLLVPNAPHESVVMVEVKSAEPNFRKPWKTKHEQKSFGSAFVLDVGNRQLLITNSHVIENQVEVLVKRSDVGNSFQAVVEYENACCDLALLSVKDNLFWVGLQSVQLLEGNPQVLSKICIAGYAEYGRSVCFTHGIASRMEMRKYDREYMELLVIHTDAKIFSGDSGGPAFDNDAKCIGVAFQSTTKSPSLASLVPSMVVKHFITDFLRQDQNGFVELGFQYDELDSKRHRTFLGMKDSEDGSGVIVTRDRLITNKLFPEDVILFFGNYEIGSDGMVEIYEGHRISFTYLLMDKHRNDEIKLYIIRKKHRMYVELTLQGFERLVPPYIRKTRPSYFVLAGIVFIASTLTYVRTLEDNSKVVRHTPPGVTQFQEVRIPYIFRNEMTRSFRIKEGSVVTRFNDREVFDLQSLIDGIKNPQTWYLKFEVNGDRFLFLDKEDAINRTAVLIREQQIAACSRDLRNWTFEA